MSWQDNAETVYNLSTLGKRQAQVAILRDHGVAPDEIVNQLGTIEENPPTPRTIQSTASKLTREYRRATVTKTVLEGGYDALQVPRQLPGEPEGTDCTLHAYIGMIASGKTVTAQSHLLRLYENGDADNSLVFDPLEEDSWGAIADNIDSVTRLTHDTPKKSPGEAIINEIKDTDPDTHTVAVIDQAHYVLREQQSFIDRVQELENNTSLRLITQAAHDLPDDETPDAYHFHRLSQDATGVSVIQDIENDADLRFQPSKAEVPVRFPAPADTGCSYCLTVLPDTGEELLRPVVLSPTEKGRILSPTDNAVES